MVLAELGTRLTNALNRLNTSTIIDDEAVTAVIQDIARALLEADVNVKIVGSLRNKIKTRLAIDDEAAGINKRKLVQRVVMEELVRYLFSFFLFLSLLSLTLSYSLSLYLDCYFKNRC